MTPDTTEHLKIGVSIFRHHGEWAIKITAPRWFIDDLDRPGVIFRKASTSYHANAGEFAEAGILLMTVTIPQDSGRAVGADGEEGT